MAEFAIPEWNNTINTLSIPQKDLADGVGDIFMAKELAENEGAYIMNNNQNLFGLPSNRLGIDEELVQFELNNLQQPEQELTNGSDISAWSDNRTDKNEQDFTRILFPEEDKTENFVQIVNDSQANLAQWLISMPFVSRTRFTDTDSLFRGTGVGRHFSFEGPDYRN